MTNAEVKTMAMDKAQELATEIRKDGKRPCRPDREIRNATARTLLHVAKLNNQLGYYGSSQWERECYSALEWAGQHPYVSQTGMVVESIKPDYQACVDCLNAALKAMQADFQFQADQLGTLETWQARNDAIIESDSRLS